MPLRDHFRPPPSDTRSREGFHGGLPMMIVAALGRSLPRHYAAEPQVHLGPSIEIDVATHEGDDTGLIATGAADEGGVAIAAGDTRPSMSGLYFKFNFAGIVVVVIDSRDRPRPDPRDCRPAFERRATSRRSPVRGMGRWSRPVHQGASPGIPRGTEPVETPKGLVLADKKSSTRMEIGRRTACPGTRP
jgi:hypothetical protein